MFGHLLNIKGPPLSRNVGQKGVSKVCVLGPMRTNNCVLGRTRSNHVGKHPTVLFNSLTLHTFWIVVFCAAGYAETKQKPFKSKQPP